MKRWALFVLSIILMGLWFPVSFFRKDERWFFADNFGLNTKFGAGEGDSVEEAFAAFDWSPHSIKNISHEWAKESPKRAVKFLSFVILALCLLVAACAPHPETVADCPTEGPWDDRTPDERGCYVPPRPDDNTPGG